MGQNESTTTQEHSTTTSESSPKSLKPPDEPPEKHYDSILEGRVFTRYYLKKGVPGRVDVLVSYHKETKSICWSSPDTIRYDPLHSMKIKDVSKVLHGKHTVALQTPLAASAQNNLCFSVVSSKLHKSIDLEASKVGTVTEFVRALDRIMEQSKMSRARWSLPAPPYQMPITQASLSRVLNASLLQFNSKALKVVRTGVRKNKSTTSSSKNARKDIGLSHFVHKLSNQPGSKPKVGSKRKTKCSPVVGAQSSVLADLPR